MILCHRNAYFTNFVLHNPHVLWLNGVSCLYVGNILKLAALFFSSTNLSMSSCISLSAFISCEPIISASRSDKSWFQVCRNRLLYCSKESKMDSVSRIGLL